MPIFDLRCKECKQEYQVRASYEERQDAQCPSCSSTKKEPVFKANIKGPVSPKGTGAGGCPSAGGCPGASSFG
ncbi:zinc ribbon domain-containing protein [Desulfuribacillus alkaliarsenatis]|uniref:Putative regulatory protein FmdB zinc ribbon domain-containing protein n=1 Tax=Desulfuribacillus alkaliarsenatis TaxID=766136 RepID=A0A1E5G405_9FIRM|nr:zinc ribbon domain-containing protein [Desulfuribacillus alkaliarsenatis]OEF97761.1 hypothetical protein BHF68_13810 [Desulfuribacillus alkaliarsenatis]